MLLTQSFKTENVFTVHHLQRYMNPRLENSLVNCNMGLLIHITNQSVQSSCGLILLPLLKINRIDNAIKNHMASNSDIQLAY